MPTTQLTRQELYELVWSKPLTTISKEYSLTTIQLQKTCREMKIPLPHNGHWSKLKHGKTSPKAILPIDYDGDNAINIQTTDIDPLVKNILETPGFALKVPNKLINPDRLILEAQHSFSEKPSPYQSSPNRGAGPHCVDIRATPKNVNRALRIMNTLIGNFKARGFTIEVQNGFTYLTKRDVSQKIP